MWPGCTRDDFVIDRAPFWEPCGDLGGQLGPAGGFSGSLGGVGEVSFFRRVPGISSDPASQSVARISFVFHVGKIRHGIFFSFFRPRDAGNDGIPRTRRKKLAF